MASPRPARNRNSGFQGRYGLGSGLSISPPHPNSAKPSDQPLILLAGSGPPASMKTRILCFVLGMRFTAIVLFLSVFHSFLQAQAQLPTIRANSTVVDVRDDGYLDRAAWNLSPQTRPDVYKASRSRKPKWVVFYTDLDSIRIRIEPGSKADFVILLNGRDSCFTRIESSVSSPGPPSGMELVNDTIPFELSPENAILVKALINQTDTLLLHFDLGTLLFRITPETLKKLKDLRLARAGNPNEKLIRSIQMGRQVWEMPEVRVGQIAAKDMDGRFGWQAFDNRILELDQEHRRLILHARLPQKAARFTKMDIRFVQSHFCAEARLRVRGKTYTGTFLFDTGSNLAMALDSAWLAHQQFPGDLPLVKKLSFLDGAGNRYETRVVSVPEVELGKDRIAHVPTSLLSGSGPLGFEVNYFGNAFLKRFNLMIDLQRDHLYIQKNHSADALPESR